MIEIARTCFLLLYDITIVPYKPKSKSESQNSEVSSKNKFQLSWKVSWKSFKWVEFQNLKSLRGLIATRTTIPSVPPQIKYRDTWRHRIRLKMVTITTTRCNTCIICLLIAASQLITVHAQTRTTPEPGKLCVPRNHCRYVFWSQTQKICMKIDPYYQWQKCTNVGQLL